jgi:hypothetical protein
MREFIKVMSVVIFSVFALVSIFPWLNDRPTNTTWIYRIVLPAVCVISAVVFLRIHFRRDLAPDLLGGFISRYFDQNGLCFFSYFKNENGVCVQTVLFQNRHENECNATIAIRDKNTSQQWAYQKRFSIQCPGGAFGRASLKVGVPVEQQGKIHVFEVGATVHYPKGKGRMLRFCDGMVVRYNSEFYNTFGIMLTVFGALVGHIVWSSPAIFSTTLPSDVAETAQEDAQPEIEILWTLEHGSTSDATVQKPDTDALYRET